MNGSYFLAGLERLPFGSCVFCIICGLVESLKHCQSDVFPRPSVGRGCERPEGISEGSTPHADTLR